MASWNPTLQEFTALKTLNYYSPQVSNTSLPLDVNDGFASGAGFTELKSAGTFSVSGGVGTITFSNETGGCYEVATSHSLSMPNVFVGVDVTAWTASGTDYNIQVGLFKDVNNAVVSIYSPKSSKMFLYIAVGGVWTELSQVALALTAPYKVGFSLAGNAVIAWYDKGLGWEFAISGNTSAKRDFTIASNYSGWKGGFGASGTSASITASYDNLKIGTYGGNTFRDCRVVHNEQGNPYVDGDGYVYVMANTGGLAGIFKLNPTLAISKAISPAPPTSTLWRINITASGGSGYASLAEVQMFGSVGGANLCTGGTPSASSQFNGTTLSAAKAFDGDMSTRWQAANTTKPCWIQYQFGSAVSIVSYSLMSPSDGSYNLSPTAFTLQYYDGGAWQTVDTQSVPWHHSAETKTFPAPDTYPMELVGVMMFSRDGHIYNDCAGDIIRYSDSSYKVFVTSWGTGLPTSVYYGDVGDTFIGSKVATVSALTLPAITGVTARYDPVVVKIGYTWYMFYNSCDTGATFYYQTLATSSDLSTWTLVGYDDTVDTDKYEGNTIIYANGSYWLMVGGPTAGGAGTTGRVYDIGLNYTGTLDATFTILPANTFPPHPMMFLYKPTNYFYLLMFNGSLLGAIPSTMGLPTLQSSLNLGKGWKVCGVLDPAKVCGVPLPAKGAGV